MPVCRIEKFVAAWCVFLAPAGGIWKYRGMEQPPVQDAEPRGNVLKVVNPVMGLLLRSPHGGARALAVKVNVERPLTVDELRPLLASQATAYLKFTD